MTILTAPAQEIAEAYERRAFDLCRADGNKGGRWSEIFTDGTLFGIVWDTSIAGAFTSAEQADVIEADLELWAPIVPPAPDNLADNPPDKP